MLSSCADTGGEREVYVVRPQDTLYSIAWRYGLDFHDLARWNNIGPDFRISVGQALTLSPRHGESATKSRPGSSGPAPRAGSGPPSGSAQRSGGAAASSGATAQTTPPSQLQWAWPTDRSGPPLPVSGGGVLLPGRLGQDVRAACAGRVVYSGTGIRGYGNLIIIKHGENLLSAYAHNSEALVREGQEVALGQPIARMGEGAPQKPVLYFEIRRNGKPVDPLRYLPVIK
jgi:lipoprotein NlpD